MFSNVADCFLQNASYPPGCFFFQNVKCSIVQSSIRSYSQNSEWSRRTDRYMFSFFFFKNVFVKNVFRRHPNKTCSGRSFSQFRVHKCVPCTWSSANEWTWVHSSYRFLFFVFVEEQGVQVKDKIQNYLACRRFVETRDDVNHDPESDMHCNRLLYNRQTYCW